MFALGNQIWLHTFGLTQGDDRWDLLALHSPLFTLENFCYLWSEGRERLLPVGGRLIPHTPRCYGLWHTCMHPSMPVLSFIQMGQSGIVVSWVPGRSIVRKATNVAAVEPPIDTGLDRKWPVFRGLLSLYIRSKMSKKHQNDTNTAKNMKKSRVLIPVGVIYTTNMRLFLTMESILDETVH